MRNINLNVSGMSIPNQQPCPWCGDTMERRGMTRLGADVNSYTMWCDACGAIQHNAICFGSKINGIEYKYDFKDNR